METLRNFWIPFFLDPYVTSLWHHTFNGFPKFSPKYLWTSTKWTWSKDLKLFNTVNEIRWKYKDKFDKYRKPVEILLFYLCLNVKDYTLEVCYKLSNTNSKSILLLPSKIHCLFPFNYFVLKNIRFSFDTCYDLFIVTLICVLCIYIL